MRCAAIILIALHVLASAFACTSKKKPSRPQLAKSGIPSVLPDSESGSEDSTLSFLKSRGTLRMLTYDALKHKLMVVGELDEKSEAMLNANRLAQSLGAYNHAQGVLPESKWTLDKMSAWMQVVDAACRSDEILKRLQKDGGHKDFLEAAYGRSVTEGEQTMLNELSAADMPAPRKARVLCSSVLLSAEFVSL